MLCRLLKRLVSIHWSSNVNKRFNYLLLNSIYEGDQLLTLLCVMLDSVVFHLVTTILKGSFNWMYSSVLI